MTTQPTTSQLATLRNEAAVRGDYRMACICSIAMHGPDSCGTDESDPAYFEATQLDAEGMTQEQAIAECTAVIFESAAQADE